MITGDSPACRDVIMPAADMYDRRGSALQVLVAAGELGAVDHLVAQSTSRTPTAHDRTVRSRLRG